MVQEQSLSHTHGKQVLELMVRGDKRSATRIAEENNWKQISTDAFVEQVCNETLRRNMHQVSSVRANKRVLGFLVGEAIKLSKGQGNPKIINEVIIRMLKEMKMLD